MRVAVHDGPDGLVADGADRGEQFLAVFPRVARIEDDEPALGFDHDAGRDQVAAEHVDTLDGILDLRPARPGSLWQLFQ